MFGKDTKVVFKLAGSLIEPKVEVVDSVAQAFNNALQWGEYVTTNSDVRFSTREVHIYRYDPNAIDGKGLHLGSVDIKTAQAPEAVPQPRHMTVSITGGTAQAQKVSDIICAALKANGFAYPAVTIGTPQPWLDAPAEDAWR